MMLSLLLSSSPHCSVILSAYTLVYSIQSTLATALCTVHPAGAEAEPTDLAIASWLHTGAMEGLIYYPNKQTDRQSPAQ